MLARELDGEVVVEGEGVGGGPVEGVEGERGAEGGLALGAGGGERQAAALDVFEAGGGVVVVVVVGDGGCGG